MAPTHYIDKVESNGKSSQQATINSVTPNQKQPHPSVLIQRATFAPDSLTPREVLQLQRVLGNQALSNLLTNTMPHPVASPSSPGGKETNVNQGALSGIIQAWPHPEVDEQPDPKSVGGFKCHDAVVYWVLRSLDINKNEAIKLLNLFHIQHGYASSDWIFRALGYSQNTPITERNQVEAGNILFTGARIGTKSDNSPLFFVSHSMIVLDANSIIGFNNFGTFGTSGGGDKFSIENWDNHWFRMREGEQWRLGLGANYSSPVYKVTHDTAKAALQQFIQATEIRKPNQTAKKGCCFITTACVTAKGLPDDCEELMVLRAFRDGYLIQRAHGKQLVDIYYQYSPRIVEAIAKQENASAIYDHLYEVIHACVEAIKTGDNVFAYKTYCEMVIKLKEQFIPDIAMPSYEI